MCRSTILLLVDIGEIISEPFDCITCCINIFGFWQRQLNKLSYQPSSTFPKRKPSCVPFVYSSKVTPLLPKTWWILDMMRCAFFLHKEKSGTSKQAIHHGYKSKDGSRQSDFSIKILTGLENWFSHTLGRPTESDKTVRGAQKLPK